MINYVTPSLSFLLIKKVEFILQFLSFQQNVIGRLNWPSEGAPMCRHYWFSFFGGGYPKEGDTCVNWSRKGTPMCRHYWFNFLGRGYPNEGDTCVLIGLGTVYIDTSISFLYQVSSIFILSFLSIFF